MLQFPLPHFSPSISSFSGLSDRMRVLYYNTAAVWNNAKVAARPLELWTATARSLISETESKRKPQSHIVSSEEAANRNQLEKERLHRILLRWKWKKNAIGVAVSYEGARAERSVLLTTRFGGSWGRLFPLIQRKGEGTPTLERVSHSFWEMPSKSNRNNFVPVPFPVPYVELEVPAWNLNLCLWSKFW